MTVSPESTRLPTPANPAGDGSRLRSTRATAAAEQRAEDVKFIDSTHCFNPTDVGNAQRMAFHFGHKIRYVQQWGWLIWDGTRWCRDETSEILRLARTTILRIYQEASAGRDERERK